MGGKARPTSEQDFLGVDKGLWAMIILLPKTTSFQCRTHGNLKEQDSWPPHLASSQTSSRVVSRGAFQPIKVLSFCFLPIIWHGPKSHVVTHSWLGRGHCGMRALRRCPILSRPPPSMVTNTVVTH